jgi:DNA-binding MarR family transcriptional regulator
MLLLWSRSCNYTLDRSGTCDTIVGVASALEPRDQVDDIVASLAATWPEVPTLPVALAARISRAASFLSSEADAVAADFGITEAGVAALIALRIAPRPHALSQAALGEQLMRTSGTLSVRMDRLEQAGLITREPDTNDARSVIVQLTVAGEALADAVSVARITAHAGLLDALTSDEQQQLARLLRKLLVRLEQRDSGPRLGVHVGPGRAAKARRRELGLAEGVGLLVRDVTGDSPAANAGIAPGDLIIRADGRQLRSAAQLKRTVSSLEPGGELALTLLRDQGELSLTVKMPAVPRP